MVTKVLPVILWVLAWQMSWSVTGRSAQNPAALGALNGSADSRPAVHAEQAADDYRMNIQGGVTTDSYNLVPLAKHDAARTQSMIDGIAGRQSTRSTPGVEADRVTGQAGGWWPRPATAILWLAGLLALALMALRRWR